MGQLEVELRIYFTHEKGGNRECVIARSIPHAMEVWNQESDVYSRNLELVLSGDWLMDLLEKDGRGLPVREFDECMRARIAEICIEALQADEVAEKQECLEQVLVALGWDLETVKEQYDIEE